MRKMKEDIAKNKKIILSVLIIILLFIGGIFYTVQLNNNHKDSKIEKQETTKKDLITYIKGLSDLTIEINAKNIDFLKDISFDKKEIKEITVDSSKVDLTKEGEYNLIYNIVPLDKTTKTTNITKTVKVISAKKAQEEANKGNQVITSNNEVKKKYKEKVNEAKKESVTDNNSVNKDSSNSGSSANNNNTGNNGNQNGGNSSNNSGKNSSSNNTTITLKPEQPKETEKPVHVHDFSIYVPAQIHTEYETVTHTEEIPVYEYKEWFECNKCHSKFNDNMSILEHCAGSCGCGYSLKSDNIQTGTKTVTTEEKIPKKVVDVPAYYKCECGETHQ